MPAMFNAIVTRIALTCGLSLMLVAGCSGATLATTPPTPPTPPTPVPTNGGTPSTPIPTPKATSASSNPAIHDYTPSQRSVWDTKIGQDQMSGACTQGSVLPAYGLVQITPLPGDGELEWKNQEPRPYPMKHIDANQYAYAGPNAIDDGVVTMTVKFLDDKNLTMLRQYTSKADPGCTHTHEYTGEFKWFR
jgi:hypothetical protein